MAGYLVTNLKNVGGAAVYAGKQTVTAIGETGKGAYGALAGTGAASKGLIGRSFEFVVNAVGGVTTRSFTLLGDAFNRNTALGRFARPLLVIGGLVAIYNIGKLVVEKIRHRGRAETEMASMTEAAERIRLAEARIERAQTADFSYLGAAHPAHGKAPDQWGSHVRGQVPASLEHGQ